MEQPKKNNEQGGFGKNPPLHQVVLSVGIICAFFSLINFAMVYGVGAKSLADKLSDQNLSWNSVVISKTANPSGAATSITLRKFFVSPTGNDNNSGDIKRPFKTIKKAALIAMPGDTILIRAGTYQESIMPKNSGKPNYYITFTNYNNEAVYVKGTAGYTFYLDNVDYIRINGLKISRGLGSGPVVIPEYKPYLGTMAHGAGIKIFYSDHNVISNNDIYDNDIGVFVSEGGTDINNLVPSTYNEIINNTIRQNGEAGVRIKRSDFTTVDSNIVYKNGLPTNNVYSEPAAGITYYCSKGITVSNNKVYGNSTNAIDNYAGTDQDTCDSSYTLMANNTLSQTVARNSTNPIFANKNIVLVIAKKEIIDPTNVYKNNIFYNGSMGSEIVAWGLNNTATEGTAITMAEFNRLVQILNPLSANNIQVEANPFPNN